MGRVPSRVANSRHDKGFALMRRARGRRPRDGIATPGLHGRPRRGSRGQWRRGTTSARGRTPPGPRRCLSHRATRSVRPRGAPSVRSRVRGRRPPAAIRRRRSRSGVGSRVARGRMHRGGRRRACPRVVSRGAAAARHFLRRSDRRSGCASGTRSRSRAGGPWTAPTPGGGRSRGPRSTRSRAWARRARRGLRGAWSSRSRSGPRRGPPPPGRRRGTRHAARRRGRRTISTSRAPTGPAPAWPLAIGASSEEDFVSGPNRSCPPREKVLRRGAIAEGPMTSKGGTRRKRPTRPDDSPLTEPRYLFARDGESLARLAEAGLAECRTRLGELVSTAGPRTIPNLLVPYDRLMLPLQEVLSQTHFLFDVHPDPDLRKVADHWYQEAQRFATELSLNRPLYDAFTALDASGEDDETRYALEKILRDFLLSGVDRDEATRARVQALRDEITAIGQDFDRIIREDVRSIS